MAKEPRKTTEKALKETDTPSKVGKGTAKAGKATDTSSKVGNGTAKVGKEAGKSTAKAGKASKTPSKVGSKGAKAQEVTFTTCLKDAGAYSPTYDYLIAQAEALKSVIDLLRKEMAQRPCVFEEVSREGEVRRRAEPVYSMFLDYSKEYRQVLGELKMTARTSGLVENDGIDELNSLVASI